MAINVYIQTSGGNNKPLDSNQNEELARQQNTPDADEQQPQTTKASIGDIGVTLAIVKSVASKAKQIAQNVLTQYADLTGNVMYANSIKSYFNMFDIKNYLNGALEMVKTSLIDNAKIRYLMERSGNNVLNGSRYTND